MKNIFLQAYYHGNLGDDLFIKILCQRYPDIRFDLIIAGNNDNRIDSIPNLNLIRRDVAYRVKNKLITGFTKKSMASRMAAKSECAILLGGSMFMEMGESKWKRILAGYREICSAAPHYFIIGANFGPYHTDGFLKEYHDFFADTDSVSFRDKWSAQLFPDIKNISCSPDIVFQLDMPKAEKKKRIAVSPIWIDDREEFAGSDKYYSTLAKFCDEAAGKGYEIDLIGFCREQNDDRACGKIVSNASDDAKKHIHTVIYNGDIDSVLSVIASAEAMVATRFHAMILGFLAECMVYPVIYSNKMENVLNDLDYKGQFAHLKTLSQLNTDMVLDENNRANISEFVRLSQNQFNALDKYLGRSK